MDYTETITVGADPATAWAALAAVTTYPRWTASMNEVQPLDGETLTMGHRYRIRQPGLPSVVWRVTEVREGESFTWEARSAGLLTVASHRLSVDADGRTVITLRLSQTGPLAGLLRRLTEAKTRRFIALEAAGLKAAAESTTIGA